MSSFSPVCTGWMEATPLHYAAKEGHTEVAKILLENKECISCANSQFLGIFSKQTCFKVLLS